MRRFGDLEDFRIWGFMACGGVGRVVKESVGGVSSRCLLHGKGRYAEGVIFRYLGVKGKKQEGVLMS